MASNAIVVPEKDKVAVGEKPKNGQVGAKNRHVLKDIGNIVIAPAVMPKPRNQIARPVTRSFGVQQLDNSKKPLGENVNCLAENDCAAKAIHTKRDHPLKPRNESVMIISPPDGYKNRKARISSSKKQGKTLTATLTARSKVACGLDKKPKELIQDIDRPDVGNELAAVEYVEDIYNFYKLTENDGRVCDYMGSQPEINSKMRSILVDWLIEVHKKFELMPESLYLTINIMDRFLSLKTVPRTELQLVGISSMLIACKYEEIWAPEVSDFIAISDNAYVRDQVLLMEKVILGKLEWYLTVPTPYVFLVRYIKASVPADMEMENMAFFYAELGLMNYSTIVQHYYCPSMLAASAVYAARCTINRTPFWSETLKHHTGFKEDQLMDCAKLLAGYHSGLAETKLRAVSRKYSNPERAAVAMFPPAKSLLPSHC